MPAVVTMATINTTHTDEGLTFAEACRQLEEAGADVVGLNCSRGPDTILPIMKEVKAVCKVRKYARNAVISLVSTSSFHGNFH